MERREIIENVINGSSNRLREKYFIKYAPSVYKEIINFTINLEIDFKFRVWHWVNNKPDYQYCHCGNRLSTKIAWEDGYRTFCSSKCSANNISVRSKNKETLLQKYGVDHYSKTDRYKDQVKQTTFERYGVNNYSQTNEFITKAKKTFLDKYGVDSYTKTEEYKIKSKQTCLISYGVDSYTKTEECKAAIKNTLYERIGIDMVFKDDNYRKNTFNIAKDPNYIRYIESSLNEFKCDNGLEHNFIISTDNYYGRKSSNNRLCTICFPISELSSLKEKHIYNFIKDNYSGDIIENYRSDNIEIDIYLPDLKIGFEFNGLYYHSDKFKSNDYHLNKTIYFESKDIRLIHIWEDDWINKQDIIKSQILNFLSCVKYSIYARKCEVRIVDIKTSRIFLTHNHIQGFTSSVLKIGLFYNNQLVSYMSFDNFEGRKRMEPNGWNLNRFCNILNTNVVGGASKLFKYFIAHYHPNRVISYADRDWSVGNLYYQLSFKLISHSNPDYKYIVDKKRVHKSRYRKSRTKAITTEREYMVSQNINRVYDCGKLKFELSIQ